MVYWEIRPIKWVSPKSGFLLCFHPKPNSPNRNPTFFFKKIEDGWMDGDGYAIVQIRASNKFLSLICPIKGSQHQI